MNESSLTVIAALAGATTVVTGIVVSLRRRESPSAWLVPAGLGVAFAAWSGYAVLDGGLLGFWPEHNGNPWEVQIWLDLLLSVSVGWFLLQPRLRRQGIAPLPWLALVLATGSIGLLAVLARLLHAERAGAGAA